MAAGADATADNELVRKGQLSNYLDKTTDYQTINCGLNIREGYLQVFAGEDTAPVILGREFIRYAPENNYLTFAGAGSGVIATQEWVNAQNFGSGTIDTSDFISKSALSQQTLQSGLSFQNGGVINIFGSNDTPVVFDRERIRYITSDGNGELNYFFNPENGGVNTIATRGYVDEKIAELRTELKAYIDETILGGKW